MREEDEINPAERELVAALKSLAPAGAEVDALAVAFSAGCQRERHRVRWWQGATLLTGLVTCAIAVISMKSLDRSGASINDGNQMVAAMRTDAGWTVFPASWSEYFADLAATVQPDNQGETSSSARRNYFAMGWSGAYFFNSADLFEPRIRIELVGGDENSQVHPWLIVGQPMGFAYRRTP